MPARHLVEDEVQRPYPSYIHPQKKQALERGTYPLAKHPATPPPLAKTMTSAAYNHLMQKIERYTGINLRQRNAVGQLPLLMFRILSDVKQVEGAHREELEQLAEEVVLQLPQFHGLDKALKAGHLKLDAKLETESIDLSGAQLQQDQPPDEEESEEIAKEVDELVGRRKFINHMIQGGATNSAYAFHLIEDKLREFGPRLPEMYGTLMALAEFGHWVTGDEAVAQALEQESAKGGKSELKQDGDVVVAVARAKSFPMLVHELVKVLLEYLSYSDEEDPETMKRVNDLADVVDDEPWQLILGPEMWRRVIAALGKDQTKFPRVYDKLMKMPTGQFNKLMQGLMSQDKAAGQQLLKLVS